MLAVEFGNSSTVLCFLDPDGRWVAQAHAIMMLWSRNMSSDKYFYTKKLSKFLHLEQLIQRILTLDISVGCQFLSLGPETDFQN